MGRRSRGGATRSSEVPIEETVAAPVRGLADQRGRGAAVEMALINH